MVIQNIVVSLCRWSQLYNLLSLLGSWIFLITRIEELYIMDMTKVQTIFLNSHLYVITTEVETTGSTFPQLCFLPNSTNWFSVSILNPKLKGDEWILMTLFVLQTFSSALIMLRFLQVQQRSVMWRGLKCISRAAAETIKCCSCYWLRANVRVFKLSLTTVLPS